MLMAISKVVFGNETLIDLTSDTVTPETLAVGTSAHMADGTQITGSMKAQHLAQVYMGATPPLNPDVLIWIDTSDEGTQQETLSTWGDLASKTWGELSGYTWGDFDSSNDNAPSGWEEMSAYTWSEIGNYTWNELGG